MKKLITNISALMMLSVVCGCATTTTQVDYIPVYPTFPQPSEAGLQALKESDPHWLIELFKLCKKLKTEAVCPQEESDGDSR